MASICAKIRSEAWYREGERTDYIRQPFTSWVGVPMIAGDKVLGVIATYDATREYEYDEDDQQVLAMLASQAAVAIENARLYYRLEGRTKELEEANRKIAQREAVEVRGMIAADFVHRLNNLAGTIPIWVDLIRQEISAQEPQLTEVSGYLDKIYRDTNSLLRAAEQLNNPPGKQEIDVAFMLQSVLRQIRIQYRKNITVLESIEPRLFKVSALPLSLVTVISSLVSNAIEAMIPKGGGTLAIKATNCLDESSEKWIKITVSDTGNGIPSELLDRLFTPFFSTKGVGKGYGLWRAKTIVEDLGGSIEVESEVGTGSIFVILLPAAASKEE
jgi:signal transduction histidine kinase